MSITKDVPVPTSYRRLHESKTLFGIHDRLMFVWMLFITVCGFSLIFINSVGIRHIIIYMIVIAIFGGVVLALARDVQTLDRNIRHVMLFFRIVRKKNITKKYVEPLDDLKKIVPIETVEYSGLIRYLDETSGVLILYVPPRTAENELDNHSLRMKNVINSLYGDFTFQFLSNSVVDFNNPLMTATTSAMKNSSTPRQVTEHLNSLYVEAKEQKESVDVEFMLLVTLPITKTTAEAEKLKSAFMQSMLKSFTRADVQARVVEDRNEVIGLLRRQLC